MKIFYLLRTVADLGAGLDEFGRYKQENSDEMLANNLLMRHFREGRTPVSF